MPRIRVIFYKEDDGTVPLADWLEDLRSQPKHRAKCINWLTLLRDQGRNLRRPKADFLRDGIHELRVKFGFGNYRMLYFFHGRELAIVTHGIVKRTAEAPPQEIDKALKLKTKYESDPESHTFYWEGA